MMHPLLSSAATETRRRGPVLAGNLARGTSVGAARGGGVQAVAGLALGGGHGNHDEICDGHGRGNLHGRW